ncbi:hypothetical protein ACVIHH_000435 [Bradyrhizobium sp. USDA 4518]
MTTQTTSAGLTCRSLAIAGSAILAIAVSSEAIASAVKIAATAQRRVSQGKPSVIGAAAAVVGVFSSMPENVSGAAMYYAGIPFPSRAIA